MAERRMFAKAVIGSGKFLRMPATARLLYYDLGMEADDDGVVEAFRVMRTTGANEDDLKILAAKGLVRVLNDELVTLITDWKVNNFVRGDRYHPSVYTDLIQTDTNGIPTVYQTDTNGIPDGNKRDTEVRLGKDSIGKVSIGESVAADAATPAKKKPEKRKFVPPTVDEVAAYIADAGLDLDAERFVDYYEANGWRVGSQSMKDWRATVRNWARRDKERGSGTQNKRSDSHVSGGYFGENNGTFGDGNSSFDTDSFWAAAVAASYADMEGDG